MSSLDLFFVARVGVLILALASTYSLLPHLELCFRLVRSVRRHTTSLPGPAIPYSNRHDLYRGAPPPRLYACYARGVVGLLFSTLTSLALLWALVIKPELYTDFDPTLESVPSLFVPIVLIGMFSRIGTRTARKYEGVVEWSLNQTGRTPEHTDEAESDLMAFQAFFAIRKGVRRVINSGCKIALCAWFCWASLTANESRQLDPALTNPEQGSITSDTLSAASLGERALYTPNPGGAPVDVPSVRSWRPLAEWITEDYEHIYLIKPDHSPVDELYLAGHNQLLIFRPTSLLMHPMPVRGKTLAIAVLGTEERLRAFAKVAWVMETFISIIAFGLLVSEVYVFMIMRRWLRVARRRKGVHPTLRTSHEFN